eukprot:TRINITY_DN3167_c0_g1_i12.p1 TRINITY_DN3167_c0_g1~~TRINITY_DN3167_c0_g1_i12.p1  ORF type:complete len:269 (-),score=24.00 TRINITY_DN3167_c0_g1_i12:42-848(-)
MLYSITIVYLVVGLLGALLLRVPTKDDYIPVQGSQMRESYDIHQIQHQSQPPVQSPSEWFDELIEGIKTTVKNPQIQILLICGFCSMVLGIFIRMIYKSYGLIYYRDDQFLTMVGTFIAIGIALGRLLWSSLLDFWSFRCIYWIMISSLLFFAITVHQIAEFGSETLYTIWLVLIVIIESGHLSTFSVVAMQIAGQKWYIVFSVLSFLSNSNLIVYLIIIFLLPTLGYGYLIVVLAILQSIPIILFPFFKGAEKADQLKKEPTQEEQR